MQFCEARYLGGNGWERPALRTMDNALWDSGVIMERCRRSYLSKCIAVLISKYNRTVSQYKYGFIKGNSIIFRVFVFHNYLTISQI